MTDIKNYPLQNEKDLQTMRDFIKRLPGEPTFVDFEESIALAVVRATIRLWRCEDRLVGLAYVDAYNNLRFETAPEFAFAQLEDEIMNWGVDCMRKRNQETGRAQTLDYSCSASNALRIAWMEKHGFKRENLRSLHYARSLSEPVAGVAFPEGYSWRCVKGEEEVESLVTLHQAAFGTENMTIEERLAIMHAPCYEREMDLLAVAPNGELAAFCICGIEEEDAQVGYTDPIGTRPSYQRLGLAKALVTAGFQALKQRGVKTVELGTSSENIGMQKLAEALGFETVSESVWFSKEVG